MSITDRIVTVVSITVITASFTLMTYGAFDSAANMPRVEITEPFQPSLERPGNKNDTTLVATIATH